MGLADQISDWLREYAARAGAEGYVVGVSGGIDSACTAALCQQAMGDQVLAALMPCHSHPEDLEAGRHVVATFGIESVVIDLTGTFDAIVEALPPGLTDMAKANLKPRLRMAALYALANTHNYLVAGTGNKSELMIGYFTKYGDGGVDVEPLGNLYKHEVGDLARELGVPQAIIDRPPSAGLWAGQTDEDEMGLTYEELDATLAALEAGKTEGIEPLLLERVQGMVARSAHKRAMPPAFEVNRQENGR